MIKYLYCSKTWSGKHEVNRMMDEINRLGQQGWRVIQLFENTNGYVAFFEIAYIDEESNAENNE